MKKLTIIGTDLRLDILLFVAGVRDSEVEGLMVDWTEPALGLSVDSEVNELGVGGVELPEWSLIVNVLSEPSLLDRTCPKSNSRGRQDQKD